MALVNEAPLTRRLQVLGADEWYHHAFGGLHVAGRVIASAFGGAGLADAAERLESPILPDWAKRGGVADIRIFDNVAIPAMQAQAAKKGAVPRASPAPAVSTITAKSGEVPNPTTVIGQPDYIALVHKSAKPTDAPGWAGPIVMVGIWGGKYFPAPQQHRYEPGKGQPVGRLFSFGYNAPLRVDIVTEHEGKYVTTSMRDVRQILFAGGRDITAELDNRQVVLGSALRRPVIRGIDW